MVVLARLPCPSTFTPEFMPMARRIGPFTITTGPTGMVVASTPWMLNSSVHAASTQASTTGRYSGLQPAITALMATFSTVTSTRSGGTTATTSSGERVVPSSIRSTLASVGAHDGQPVGPAAGEQRLDLVLEVGQLDPPAAQDRAAEAHPQVVDEVGVDRQATRSPAGTPGRSEPRLGDAAEGFPLRPVPADGALDLARRRPP